MYVERTAQGVTIRLSTDEARCLRSDLDLIPTKQSGNPELFRKLVSGLTGAVNVTAANAADAIREVASEISDREDRHDLRRIADLLAAGDLVAAKRATANLDTAVRDEIPREAWPFVGLRAIR